MQDKRKASEAANAALQAQQPKETEKPTGETAEERGARMRAQRDLLRRMKEEKRQKELDDFNS